MEEKDLPVTIYSAESPIRRPLRLLREMLEDIWRARELTRILFIRDLKAQYRESYLGYLWLFLPPVMTTVVWVFLNAQKVVRVETEIPYPLFVVIGTTVWSSFAATVGSPLIAFNGGKPVFVKLKVPHEAFILSGFFRSSFDMVVRLLMLVPVFFVFGITPPATVLLFPVALIILLSIGFAIGLMVIPVGGLYGDAGNLITTVMGVLMYTVPVVFPVPEGDGILATIMRWNPLSPAIILCRETITSGDLAQLVPALGWLVAATFLILVSLVVLRIGMPHLVERMGM